MKMSSLLADDSDAVKQGVPACCVLVFFTTCLDVKSMHLVDRRFQNGVTA
jgi:hypothetical protein